MKSGKVYIVCAMDTEGPIRNKKKPDILQNWKQVNELIKLLTSKKFRNSIKDTAGKGLVYSWFLLTLTGFKTNPFKRPMNYHEVFDNYNKNFGKNFKHNKDGVYWHYHQPSKNGVGNEWTKDWTISQEYFNIMSRLVSERSYYPTCFRAGGRIENNDTSNWLEEWIPYDFSNCSGKVNWFNKESDGKLLIDLVDWSKASTAWRGYNPSKNNYQKKGNLKRYIFRSPDLNSNVHKIVKKDIEQAFIEAQEGKNACLSFFEHDRRMKTGENIYNVMQLIKKVSLKFKKIKWEYKNAIDAANLTLKQKKYDLPKFDVFLKKENRIQINVKGDLYNRNPYVCYKIKNKIYEQPLNLLGLNKWISAPFKDSEIKQMRLSVAGCTPSGIANVQHFKYKTNDFKKIS